MSDTQEWKWKRWDVRSDGKVFWKYQKTSKNGELWIDWDSAIKAKSQTAKAVRVNYQKNKEKKQEYGRKYAKTNRERDRNRINIYNKHYRFKRNKRDLLFCLKQRLRVRLCHFIRRGGYKKTAPTRLMLGCDWDHFIAHLESRFVDGMTWDNRHLWHIDHIIPLASATSEEELIKLNHYTNLQPLWAKDNLRKGDKIQGQA